MKKFSKLLVIVLGLYLIAILSRSVINLWQRHGRLQKAQEILVLEKKKYEELEFKKQYVEKNEYIEKEARERLLFTKPGESVVLIDKELFRELEGTASAEIVDTRPNWQKWLELFF